MQDRKRRKYAEIGDRLQRARYRIRAREGKHVTQAWVAEKVGVKTNTYQAWEAGRYPPHRDHQTTLAKVLQTSTGHIMRGDSEPHSAGEAPAATRSNGAAAPTTAEMILRTYPPLVAVVALEAAAADKEAEAARLRGEAAVWRAKALVRGSGATPGDWKPPEEEQEGVA